eukprot:15352028-Ditylum_brightwellii.AAC.1
MHNVHVLFFHGVANPVAGPKCLVQDISKIDASTKEKAYAFFVKEQWLYMALIKFYTKVFPLFVLEERSPKQEDNKKSFFKEHYGSSSVVVSNILGDLHQTSITQTKLTPEEATQKGFKMFMMVHFF